MDLFSDNNAVLEKGFDSITAARLSRRDFLRFCSGIAAVLSMPSTGYAKTSLTGTSGKHSVTVKGPDLKSVYPATLTVLKNAYIGEMKAHLHYIEYAKRAKKEKYPNIAYLFTAFAASEYTHAREFRAILSAFGITEEGFEESAITVSRTKTNLKTAAENELIKIESVYPGFLKKLRAEKHGDSQRNCLYAWKSHEQHSAHLKKIIKWSGFFFGFLAKKFEDNPVQYFVCRICGSTLIQLPQNNCPVCSRPVSEYRKIERDQTDFI